MSTAPALIREADRFRSTMQRPEELVATFQGAAVYVRCTVDPPAVPVAHVEGLPWLPVFSSLTTMAGFFRERGEADQPLDYLVLTGARLLEVYLPGMPRGTNIMLDPLQEHAVAVPSLVGIVPDSVAADRDAPDGAVPSIPPQSPYERPVRHTWSGAL